MLQKGTLYSPSNNENAVEFKKPIPNVFIYFSQNGNRKYTVKTDGKGAFSVDLALGSYQVTISQGAGFDIYPLGGGAPFELTSASKQNAFEQWVLAPIYLKPEENPLVILMNELVKDSRDSATKAKSEADRAEQAVSDTVGDGKIMREGAFGVGGKPKTLPNYDYTNDDPRNLSEGITLNYITSGKNNPTSRDGLLLTARWANWGMQWKWGNGNRIAFSAIENNDDGRLEWCELYHTSNTTVDSNGFIKAASPIIKLFTDHIEAKDSFREEPVFEKISAGVYRISNTLGLAQSGWTYNVPKDGNDKPYFHVIVQKTLDGAIISVHDQFETRKKKKIKDIYGDEQTVEVVEYILSEARDIKPHERWIDLRFHEAPVKAELLVDMEGEHREE